MARAEYKTDNRKTILSYFQENENRALSVADINQHLTKINKKINLSTIYRYLDKLEREGIIIKHIADQGTKATFQYCGEHECEHHLHLTCVGCGNTIHLECDFMNEISSHIADHHHFHLQCKDSVLYGVCEHCAKKTKSS